LSLDVTGFAGDHLQHKDPVQSQLNFREAGGLSTALRDGDRKLMMAKQECRGRGEAGNFSGPCDAQRVCGLLKEATWKGGVA
jgi:hypothetical protein